jgi:hypothetical protein
MSTCISEQEVNQEGKCLVDASIQKTIAQLKQETAKMEGVLGTLQKVHNKKSAGGYYWLGFIVLYMLFSSGSKEE